MEILKKLIYNNASTTDNSQKNVLCYMCFACLNYCPKESVQINEIPFVKSYTKENERYSHPYAKVKDISNQKEI